MYRSISKWINKRYIDTYRYIKKIPSHAELIHSLVSQDKFVLIVLDGCRYDVFEQLYTDYLDGDLKRAWAVGRWTKEYISRTYTDYYDLKYCSTAPVISNMYFKEIGSDYRPTEHFAELRSYWESHWAKDLGTVPPEPIANELSPELQNSTTPRYIIHLLQPHAPYIGDTEILPWEVPPDNTVEERLTSDTLNATDSIKQRIRSGEITDNQLRRGYLDNLRRVLKTVQYLAFLVECPVIVTADHGEHLGEKGYYLHDDDSTLIRQVPWLQVSEVPNDISTPEIKTQSNENPNIKQKLRDLGYR